MSWDKFDYRKSNLHLLDRLERAHNQHSRTIRTSFFKAENSFFRKFIRDQVVFVAGSGLGHDSFELAAYNKSVVGIEINPTLVSRAKRELKGRQIGNTRFVRGDFFQTHFKGGVFDSAVLNMGTICNFSDQEKIKLILEMLRVARAFYFDFYTTSLNALQERKSMYEQEGWRNVRIRGKAITSDDGLYSESLTRERLGALAHRINKKIDFCLFHSFTEMAKVF